MLSGPLPGPRDVQALSLPSGGGGLLSHLPAMNVGSLFGRSKAAPLTRTHRLAQISSSAVCALNENKNKNKNKTAPTHRYDVLCAGTDGHGHERTLDLASTHTNMPAVAVCRGAMDVDVRLCRCAGAWIRRQTDRFGGGYVCTHAYTHVCTHVYTQVHTHVYTDVWQGYSRLEPYPPVVSPYERTRARHSAVSNN